jgi:hypothetical protein
MPAALAVSVEADRGLRAALAALAVPEDQRVDSPVVIVAAMDSRNPAVNNSAMIAAGVEAANGAGRLSHRLSHRLSLRPSKPGVSGESTV